MSCTQTYESGALRDCSLRQTLPLLQRPLNYLTSNYTTPSPKNICQLLEQKHVLLLFSKTSLSTTQTANVRSF